MTAIIQTELAALALAEAAASVVDGERYAIVQRDPQPSEAGISAGTDLRMILVDLDGEPGAPLTPTFRVTADGAVVVTYNGTASWGEGWSGTVEPVTTPYVGWIVDAAQAGEPLWGSEQTVSIVVQIAGSGGTE